MRVISALGSIRGLMLGARRGASDTTEDASSGNTYA